MKALRLSLLMLALAAVPACGHRSQPASAASGSSAPAGSTPASGPWVFIQAGDPQIGGWGSIEDSVERFARVVQAANQRGAACVVIVGDIVNDGDNAAELSAVQAVLAKFKMPVAMVPGNHDDPAAFRRVFGPSHRVFTFGDCDFICADSNALAHWTNRQSLADAHAELDWIDQTITQSVARGQAHRFLVMHHPPEQIGPSISPRLNKLMRQGQVDAILCGHIHANRTYTFGGVPVYCAAGSGWSAEKSDLGYVLWEVDGKNIKASFMPLPNAASATHAKPQH